MFSKIISLGLFGMEAYKVIVEADISGGMPRFDIVGLPDTAVSESKERVRSAIKNTNLKITHRLVAEDDCKAIGESMGLSKEQRMIILTI